jgi:uncharacterized protein (TIGR02391 family)
MLPHFNESQLRQLCNVLADTQTGLTNAEIGDLLHQLRIPDIGQGENKRTRLYLALARQGAHDQSGVAAARFMEVAMEPVRYHGDQRRFDGKRIELNGVLAFCGYEMGADGRLRVVKKATTLDEASARANRLRAVLVQRGVHSDVLRFCKAELVDENFFHAVLEATKSVFEKLRSLTGLSLDGAALVDRAFLGDRPLLAINSLGTDTERSEQAGFANLLKGTFGTFRNPTAHAPKVAWPVTEQDALDLLTLVSYLHRRIDSAAATRWS